jgi:TPR repeat protein
MNIQMPKFVLCILVLSVGLTGCVSESGRPDYKEARRYREGSLIALPLTGMYHLLDWAGGKYVDLPPALPHELTMTVFEYQQMDTAARKGDPVAQNAVGLCYAKGKAVVKDEALAVDWYRRSAGQGYGPAFVNLSDCYAQGAGVTKDQVEAYAYARLASQVGAAGPQRLVEMEGRLTPLEVVAGSQRALSLWSELMLKAKSPPIDEAKR